MARGSPRILEGTWIPIIGGAAGFVVHWFGGTPGIDDCLLITRVNNFAEATPCNVDGVNDQYHKGHVCECDGNGVDPATF